MSLLQGSCGLSFQSSLKLFHTSVNSSMAFQHVRMLHAPLTPWHLHSNFILRRTACKETHTHKSKLQNVMFHRMVMRAVLKKHVYI